MELVKKVIIASLQDKEYGHTVHLFRVRRESCLPKEDLDRRFVLQELAKRFSVMFGLDLVKNREALTSLHRAGIAFAALEAPAAAPGPNLHFLDALAEFSNKLLRQDKRHVLKVPIRPREVPCCRTLLSGRVLTQRSTYSSSRFNSSILNLIAFF